MPNKILVATNATPLVWANFADYTGDGGVRTHPINLTSLISGAALQGDKADIDNDLVTDRFAFSYAVTVRIEMREAATPGGSVDLYWAASPSVIEGIANPGGVIGENGDYIGTTGSTLEESLKELQFLGPLIITEDGPGIIQQATFKVVLPLQYGTPVIVNNTASDFIANAIEMSITFTPRELEAQ